MIGFIITGHGMFASGLLSSMDVIMSNQSMLEGQDFLKEDSSEALKDRLYKIVRGMDKQCEGIVIFTDLAGGTPYRLAVEISLEFGNCEVIAGSNLPMIMENIFNREFMSLEDITESCLTSGKNSISKFSLASKKEDQEQEDVNEGI